MIFELQCVEKLKLSFFINEVSGMYTHAIEEC